MTLQGGADPPGQVSHLLSQSPVWKGDGAARRSRTVKEEHFGRGLQTRGYVRL